MGIEDTIVRIGRRVQNLGAEGFLFHRTVEPGISLNEDERFLREFMAEHPSKKYYLVGLGNVSSLKKLVSTHRLAYNGIMIKLASITGKSSFLRHIGVNIENPPDQLSRKEKNDLRVFVPGTIFDMIVPELITIGYGTGFGNFAGVTAHYNNGDYWTIGEVNIGRHVFIGATTVISPGVTIGDYAKINIGSVVLSDVPPGKIYAGNPAKEVGDRYLRTVDTSDDAPKLVLKRPKLD